MTHPIRKAKIHTFQRYDDEEDGSVWVARFYPYKTYPIIFSGETEQEVLEAAEAMRSEAIEKHENECIRRQKLSERNKARKASKKVSK